MNSPSWVASAAWQPKAYFPFTLDQVSRRPTVRLKTSLPSNPNP